MVTNSNSGKARNGATEKPAETKQSERGTTRMHGAAKQLPQIPSFAPLLEKRASLNEARRQEENAFDEAFAAYLKNLEEHLQGNSERVGKIEKRLDYMDTRELPTMRNSLDTVTGTTKRLEDTLRDMGEEVRALKDTAAGLNQLKEEFKSGFDKMVEEIKKTLQDFEDRLAGFDERIKDAEKAAFDAETIAEGLRTIVVETHQLTLQQTEEKLSRLSQEVAQVKDSFTPASSYQAAEVVKGIPTQPLAPVNSQVSEDESSAESRRSVGIQKISTESKAKETDVKSHEVAKLMEENEKTLESQGDEITQLEEIVKEALSKLGLSSLKHLVEPKRESIERFSKYESATDFEKELLNRVDQHITKTRKQEGRLEVLCEGVNRCLEYKGFEHLQEGKKPEEIVLEHPEKCASFFPVVKIVQRAEEGVKRELEKQKDTIEKIGQALEKKILGEY
ncbi:MAG: hypothetical protein QXT45_03600 [Candidatus Bilamarchaeaceae archaeon]